MHGTETLPVTITSTKNNSSTGTVALKVWGKQEQTARAFKALGIAWGLAMASVLIPILHFVLVPIFLIAGPIAFSWVASQEQIILGGGGECPDCKRQFDIVRASVKWPLSDICNHCRSHLRIHL